MVVNMVNVVFYEGGMQPSLFGFADGPKWSICMYVCTCCQWNSEDRELGIDLPEIRQNDDEEEGEEDEEDEEDKDKFKSPVASKRGKNNADKSTTGGRRGRT